MKDNFSHRSDNYAKFRPEYPQELFALINNLVSEKKTAWDCATGSGQIASQLSDTFEKVFATDISENQIKNAHQAKNIEYSVQPAEGTNFEDNTFDLITVGQAIHWFDFYQFYREVNRVIKPNGLIVITGYGLHQIDDKIDPIVYRLYEDIVGAYWDEERRYVEQGYRTIPFPFDELSIPNMSSQYEWSLDQLVGYLSTWSAVKHYQNKKNEDPIELITEDLKQAWKEAKTKKVTFPTLLRIGRVPN